MEIIYNGINGKTLGVEKVMRVTRPVYPGARDRLQRIFGRPGALDFGRDLEPIYIPTRLFLKAGSFAGKRAQLRNIAAWINQEECKQLIFSDEPDKYYLARPTSPVNPEDSAFKTWLDITWLCPEPCAFSIATKTAGPNEGTLPTPVRIAATIIDDADNFEVALGPSFIRINHSLVAGDVVVIDTGQRYASINEEDARPFVTYDSKYFWLPVGEFEITAANATLEIVFRERWI